MENSNAPDLAIQLHHKYNQIILVISRELMLGTTRYITLPIICVQGLKL